MILVLVVRRFWAGVNDVFVFGFGAVVVCISGLYFLVSSSVITGASSVTFGLDFSVIILFIVLLVLSVKVLFVRCFA